MCARLALAFALGVASPTLAEDEPRESSPDKSGYTFANPTPRALLRDMSTDRPDQTESAYTVDAGRYQIEMDLVRAFLDSEAGEPEFVVAPINFKIGLLNDLDIQFVLDTFVLAEDASGVGDFVTRVKWNIYGNDSGRTALAFMPYVKWPLPQNDLRNGKTEGGLIFPFAADLGGGFGLGAMTQVDLVASPAGGYETEWFNTLTVGHDLTAHVGMYVEVAAVNGSARGFDWEWQGDVGFTYAMSDDARFDWGCNFGLTDGPPDYSPWIGFSTRF
jgi:hypothetical protein